MVRSISGRQIFPGSAGPKDPKDPVEYLPAIAPGPTAAVLANWIVGKDGTDNPPLLFGQVHP